MNNITNTIADSTDPLCRDNYTLTGNTAATFVIITRLSMINNSLSNSEFDSSVCDTQQYSVA